MTNKIKNNYADDTKDNNDIIKINNDSIFSELIKNQNKQINSDKRLLYNDIKRISKNLSKSIFGNECSLWNGYITIIKNDTNKSYINFYFKGKKCALHRLLYINYIGNLPDSEYIKYKCDNKGVCCNINHIYKINAEITETNNITNNTKNEPKLANIIVNFN